jgi:hypothetical protein
MLIVRNKLFTLSVIMLNVIMLSVIELSVAAKYLVLAHKIRGWLIEQKLMLRSTFSCYQIHNCQRYDFGLTLLCHLSRTCIQPTHSLDGSTFINKVNVGQGILKGEVSQYC